MYFDQKLFPVWLNAENAQKKKKLGKQFKSDAIILEEKTF